MNSGAAGGPMNSGAAGVSTMISSGGVCNSGARPNSLGPPPNPRPLTLPTALQCLQLGVQMTPWARRGETITMPQYRYVRSPHHHEGVRDKPHPFGYLSRGYVDVPIPHGTHCHAVVVAVRVWPVSVNVARIERRRIREHHEIVGKPVRSRVLMGNKPRQLGFRIGGL